MRVKDLVQCFSFTTKYTICLASNSSNILWWGKGNKLHDNPYSDDLVIGIHHKPKEIIIYI